MLRVLWKMSRILDGKVTDIGGAGLQGMGGFLADEERIYAVGLMGVWRMLLY